MHLQIVKADRQLTERYVANWPHRWTMWIGLTEKPRVRAELTKRLDVKRPDIRARGTLLKYRSRIFWIDGHRTRAAPKAPQRKRPCRSRASARRSLLPSSFGYAKRRMPLELRLRASGCDGETVMTERPLPLTMLFSHEFVAAGGLMSYGSFADRYRETG